MLTFTNHVSLQFDMNAQMFYRIIITDALLQLHMCDMEIGDH